MQDLQLNGHRMIPKVGKNDVMGCPIIDGWSLRPVMNPNNGAPINLGQGCTGSVDLVRHQDTGYLMATKVIFMESPER